MNPIYYDILREPNKAIRIIGQNPSKEDLKIADKTIFNALA
jgi:hypothetical protein